MLKRHTDTIRLTITFAILAASALGCSDASSGKTEDEPATPGNADDATQNTPSDTGQAGASGATTENSDGPGASAPTETSAVPSSDEALPPEPANGQGASDAGTQPVTLSPPSPEPQASAPSGPDAGLGGPTQPPLDAATPTTDEVQSACFAVAGDGPCENCVCEACVVQLDECAATAGCPEILECVLESGCTGLDCYCGDDTLPACLGGQGNGPCRSAVLDAPGGRQPDALNPSGGPASDAALAVSECSADVDTCGDVCESVN